MQLSAFQILDHAVKDTLENIMLSDLVSAAEKYKAGDEIMYYI